MTKPSHIFIVGLNRTGTNLIREALNNSQEVAICGETHYLKHWVGYRGYQHELAKVGNISTNVGVRKVVEYIYNIHSNSWRGINFWRWIQQNVPREEFRRRLLESDRSDHAILDVVMDSYAAGKPIHGEKTPAHIHSVPTLLRWYPKAKIIHTFRDPRAIFVSEKRRQLVEHITLPYRILWRSELALEILLSFHVAMTWLRITQLHYRYQQLYPDQYYLCRYEDLVSDPEVHFEKICDFLEIDFTVEMLLLSFQNSSLVPRHQAPGVDASAANRWRKYLHPVTHKWMIFWSRRRLLELGYQP